MSIRYRFDASFGGVPLQIVSWSEDLSWDIVQWRPARGRGAQMQARGKNPRQYTLAVVLTGTADEVTAGRDTLNALADTGAARNFVHPVDGPIVCRLVEFSSEVTASEVTYRMTLVEDTNFAAKLETQDRTSLQDVTAAGDAYDATVPLVLDADGTLPDASSAVTAAQSWNTSTPTREEIEADMGPVREEHAAARESLRSASSLEAYQALIALNDLAGTLQRYAFNVARAANRVTSLQLDSPVPLMVLLAEFYGADAAYRVKDTVVKLNSIKDPLRLAAGTVIKLPILEA